MSIAPGVQDEVLDQPPPRSAPTSTGVAFVAATASKGPIGTPVPIQSIADLTATFGERLTSSLLYDWLDTFFHEGGSSAYVSRRAGAGAAQASHDLLDGSAAVSLHVFAKYAGSYGDGLDVAVLTSVDDPTIPAGQYRLQISGAASETSGNLTSQADAVAWAANSGNVSITLGPASDIPVRAAAVALAGGSDGAAVTDATLDADLAQFTKDKGPGQVALPGLTTDAAHQALARHADANNRVDLCDFPDTSSKATLLTSAGAVRSMGTPARWSGGFAPWIEVPGVLAGTTRVVPPSALLAGLVARNEGLGLPTNQAAAGPNGQAQWAIGLSQPAWTDADRADLNGGGVNVIIMKYGGVRVYGFRTLTDPLNDPNWIELNWARLKMDLVNEGNIIMEGYEFGQLDGQGHLLAQAKSDLTGMLLGFYGAEELYGSIPASAFTVDVGPQVNPLANLAAGRAAALLKVRMSPFAEVVTLQVAKIPTSEEIS